MYRAIQYLTQHNYCCPQFLAEASTAEATRAEATTAEATMADACLQLTKITGSDP